MEADTTKPKFFNDRVSKEILLAGAKKVRVAAMDRPLRKPVNKPEGRWAKIEAILDHELSQPGMKEAALVLAAAAVVMSGILAIHAYDMEQGGDGIVVLNAIADVMDG